jgi:tRNA dimethylallyltransferase
VSRAVDPQNGGRTPPPLAESMVVIVGPTGIGKSDLAMSLAGDLNGGLISADAMQVYRGFDLGTAKPGPDARRRIPHELVDVADPRVDFSAGDFVRAADAAVVSFRNRGLRPMLVGGTGLYVRTFLGGLSAGPRRSPALRARLRESSGRHGLGHLHRMLGRLDPAMAARLAPADDQRLVRALEVRFGTGQPLSEHLARDGDEIWQRRERYDAVKIGLRMDRDRLMERLARRVHAFFDSGLVEEVRGLLAAGILSTANAFKGIGYRESLDVVGGRCSEAEARERTLIATRQYAKRQMTWFRREPDLHWLDGDVDRDRLHGQALALIRQAD